MKENKKGKIFLMGSSSNIKRGAHFLVGVTCKIEDGRYQTTQKSPPLLVGSAFFFWSGVKTDQLFTNDKYIINNRISSPFFFCILQASFPHRVSPVYFRTLMPKKVHYSIYSLSFTLNTI